MQALYTNNGIICGVLGVWRTSCCCICHKQLFDPIKSFLIDVLRAWDDGYRRSNIAEPFKIYLLHFIFLWSNSCCWSFVVSSFGALYLKAIIFLHISLSCIANILPGLSVSADEMGKEKVSRFRWHEWIRTRWIPFLVAPYFVLKNPV